jgi:hypothetical protein
LPPLICLPLSKFKGTVSRDFLLLVFFMNQFPPSPRVFHLDPFEFFRNFAEIFASQGLKVHHRYQRHRRQICHRCQRHRRQNCCWYQRHRWQICHGYQRHRWQIFPPFSLALLIPVANLPPVSTIPAVNLPPVSTTPVANCHRYQRHRWQIMATISGCRHLKENLKAKIYINVNSTIQRCPNKIIKNFQLEGFFHLPSVSLTPVANLELRISPRIFEKI